MLCLLHGLFAPFPGGPALSHPMPSFARSMLCRQFPKYKHCPETGLVESEMQGFALDAVPGNAASTCGFAASLFHVSCGRWGAHYERSISADRILRRSGESAHRRRQT